MKVFYGMGGGLRQSMSYQDISNLYIPVPPLSEQRTIVSYITDKTAKIDTLTSKLQQEIESIKEYKQRLISDVVTGQIKIC
jgi:restriction endonuclease S subunit